MTKEYLKSVINWKAFNLILDKMIQLEDNGVEFDILALIGEYSDSYEVYEYSYLEGEKWTYIEGSDFYNKYKYYYEKYGMCYRIFIFRNSNMKRAQDIILSTNKFDIVYEDTRSFYIKEKK